MANFPTKRFHFIIDAWNCDSVALRKREKVERTLLDLVKLCEMNILYGPIISDGCTENPGLTGFVTIDFSHISIHTFPASKELCVDVFSCKEFDTGKIQEYVKEAFNLDEKSIKSSIISHKMPQPIFD